MQAHIQECIDNCQTCQEVCLQTLQYCKEQGGEHTKYEHLKLLEDCAKICETSADFMQRESTLHTKVCKLCSEICEQCAESCEQFVGDEQMQQCVEICKTCAESCQSMSSE